MLCNRVITPEPDKCQNLLKILSIDYEQSSILIDRVEF